MTIARKKTIITAAVAVSVLAAGGIATPTGQMPIASAPIRHVSTPTGPSLASLATPNTLLAAVSSLPTASGRNSGRGRSCRGWHPRSDGRHLDRWLRRNRRDGRGGRQG